MSDAESALAQELQASRARAEELAALLDAERKRAAEAERLLQHREKLLAESNRPKVNPEEARVHRQVLAQNLSLLRQHSQRYSNASKAVEVVLPGIQANAKKVRGNIATHFGFLRKRLQEREDKLQALVEGLAAERVTALEAQRGRMDFIVGECEKCISGAEEVLNGDDWSVLTKHDAVNALISKAVSQNCKIDADWTEQIVASMPGTLEEIIESHGVVSMQPLESQGEGWERDLAIVSRINEPPIVLQSSRNSLGNSDYGFMFEVHAHDTPVCVKALHAASSAGWGPYLYTVWTAQGAWKPIRTSKKRWTKVGSGEMTLPKGKGQYTALPMCEEGVHIGAGGKQSFYIHSAAHATAVAFTQHPHDKEGNSIRDGNVIDSDGRISIVSGAKTCSTAPFESVATDCVRAFAGCVEYVLWCEA